MSFQICPACDGRSDDGLICPRCTYRYRKDLRSIVGLMKELDTTLTRQSQTGSGNGGKNATRPLPFDVHASEMWDEAKTFLVNWVRTFTLGDWPDDTIPSICAWLLDKDQRIRGHEEGAYFVDEIGDVVRRLRRAIDLRPEMVYLGVCPHVLGQERGEDGEQHPVTCRHQMYARKRDESYDCPGEPGIPCGAIYNVEERQAFLWTLARDQRATIGDCAKVLAVFGLPVKSETIWNWARARTQRGTVYPAKVWPVGHNDKGENVYRVGDIEELAREAIERKDAKNRARAS